MPLPQLPKPTTIDPRNRPLLVYLERWRQQFPNAAGEALDPTGTGQGGAGALTITEPPSAITYTAGGGLNAVNHTQEAFIECAFTLPARAVGCEVFYREQGTTDFKQSYASASPYRLLHLQPGTTYEVQLAGEAANGSLGPRSALTPVPTSGNASEVAPSTVPYVTTAAVPALSQAHVLQGEATVVTIDTPPGQAVVGLASLGVSTAKLASQAVTTPKLANLAVTTAKRQALHTDTAAITLTGTGADIDVIEQRVAFTHTLGAPCLVTPSLGALPGESASARVVGVFVQHNDATGFTVRVVGVFLGSTDTLTTTLTVWYW